MFRGIAVSLLRPVIGSNVEIDVVVLNWVADVRKQIAAAIKRYICYLPGGRSVWEKTVPEVLSMARGRRPRVVLKTKDTVFSHTDRPSPVNNMFIFFLQ